MAADPGTVRGPYYDRSQKRWTLRWTEGGESRAFTRDTRAEVAAMRAEVTGTTPTPSRLKPLPETFVGDAPQIKAALVDAMHALNAATRAGDDDQLMRLRKYVAALSEASHAVVPHTQYAKMKEEFDALIAYVQDIQRGRVDAGQPQVDRCINSTLADQPRPPTAVH